jgi:hypothetical protein
VILKGYLFDSFYEPRVKRVDQIGDQDPYGVGVQIRPSLRNTHGIEFLNHGSRTMTSNNDVSFIEFLIRGTDCVEADAEAFPKTAHRRKPRPHAKLTGGDEPSNLLRDLYR